MGRGRVGSMVVAGLAVVVLGACGSADEDAAVEYKIGTRISTTTTTTAPVEELGEEADRTALLREIAANSAAAPPADGDPAAEVQAEAVEAPAPPHCFAMEQFIFESTQMLLGDDLPLMRERAGNALGALTTVAEQSPPLMAEPADELRGVFAAMFDSPDASASADGFRAAATGMVQANSSLIDGLIATAVDVCEAELTEPLMSSSDGADLVTGAGR